MPGTRLLTGGLESQKDKEASWQLQQEKLRSQHEERRRKVMKETAGRRMPDLESVTRQPPESCDGDVVQCQNLEHCLL